MIKKIGYLVFALFFSVFRLFRVDGNKVFLVATHDDGPENGKEKSKYEITNTNKRN